MDRRRFLKILAGAAAAPAVTYFLPPIGGWRSDVIVHPSNPCAVADVLAAQLEAIIAAQRKDWVHYRMMRMLAEQRLALWTHGGYVTYTRTA